MGLLMGAAIAGAGLQMMGTIIQGDLAKSQAQVNAERSKVQGDMAKLQGEADALALKEDYNRTQANNAVIAAASGRSGATVNAIGIAARSELDWDLQFMEFSKDMAYNSAMLDAEGYKTAGEISQKTSMLNAGMTGLNTAMKLYAIGGSTQGDD